MKSLTTDGSKDTIIEVQNQFITFKLGLLKSIKIHIAKMYAPTKASNLVHSHPAPISSFDNMYVLSIPLFNSVT